VKLVKEEEEYARELLMEIQSLRGFKEKEAIREVLKRFLAAIIAG